MYTIPDYLNQKKIHHDAKSPKLILTINSMNSMVKVDLFGAKITNHVEEKEPHILDQKSIYKQAKKRGILQARFTRVFGETNGKPIPGSTFTDKARQATKLIKDVMCWHFAEVKQNLNCEFHDPRIQKGIFD